MYAQAWGLRYSKWLCYDTQFFPFLSMSSSFLSSSSLILMCLHSVEDEGKKNWLKFLTMSGRKEMKLRQLMSRIADLRILIPSMLYIMDFFLLCVVFVMLLDVCRTCSSFCQSLEAVMFRKLKVINVRLFNVNIFLGLGMGICWKCSVVDWRFEWNFNEIFDWLYQNLLSNWR